MNLNLERLARDENTPPEQLKEIAKQNIKLARIVAKNHSADAKLLRELAANFDRELLAAITNNPNTPPDILWQLAADFPQQLLSNPVFELLFLENPNLLEEMPEETAIALLKQETIPEWFLVQAIKIQYNSYSYIIASNRNTPNVFLEKLAKNTKSLVRIAIAKNPNTSSELLKKLVQDKTSIICLVAAKEITQRLAKYERFLSSDGLFEYSEIVKATNIEMKRLGWTTEKDRNYLKEIYGKRSRHSLTDDELLQFWEYLMSLE